MSETAPKRIQLKRTKGWRIPPNTVKVDRTTKWGNPFNLKSSSHCWTAIAQGFKADPAGRHAASISMFVAWVQSGEPVTVDRCGLYAESNGQEIEISKSPDIEAPTPPTIEEIQSELRGKNLACFCALDAPCHADVLLEIANK